MRAILLNGPPLSGKDTIGRRLAMQLAACGYKTGLEKMATPIRQAALTTFPHTLETDDDVERLKNKSVFPHLNNQTTLRSWMIAYSEKLMKPLFGEQIFGHMLVDRIYINMCDCDFVVVTDCGFEDEVIPLRAWLGDDRIYLCHLHRTGYNFEGDSRSYIEPSGLGHVDVEVGEGEDEVSRAVEKILGICLSVMSGVCRNG